MNPLNYASLEASRRLKDAGIVLETEVSWWTYPRESDGTDWQWEIVLSPKHYTDKRDVRYIPAPSMAEVWRELPEFVGENAHNEVVITKTGLYTNAGYNDFTCNIQVSEFFSNINATDALIYLKIYIEEQRIEVQNGKV